MTAELAAFVERELGASVSDEVARLAELLATQSDGLAVLFYGSVLRTNDLEGVLDFYVLTEKASGSFLRRLGMTWLWPDVSFHEVVVNGRTVRAKVATMPLSTFERASRGATLDTTIWTRFVQPSALVWRRDPAIAKRVVRAVADADITAGLFAAALGPPAGAGLHYWQALFRETYRVELRVEPPGRETHILSFDPDRYATLLPLAWTAGGVPFEREGDVLSAKLSFDQCCAILRVWLEKVRMGKALNVARLFKAAFTFEGASRYGLWKIERHTGVGIALTPWREHHPVLAAPGVLWRVFRSGAR